MSKLAWGWLNIAGIITMTVALYLACGTGYALAYLAFLVGINQYVINQKKDK
jgi:hypothetical protein